LTVRIFILLCIFYDYSVQIKKTMFPSVVRILASFFAYWPTVVNYWIYIFFHTYICDKTNSNRIFYMDSICIKVSSKYYHWWNTSYRIVILLTHKFKMPIDFWTRK
jgi:hypothetical protein